MTRFGYDTELLRAGARHGDDAAGHAARAAAELPDDGVPCPFGAVQGAAALHGAVLHARQTHRQAAERTAQALHSAAEAVQASAAIGDANTEATARIAGGSGS